MRRAAAVLLLLCLVVPTWAIEKGELSPGVQRQINLIVMTLRALLVGLIEILDRVAHEQVSPELKAEALLFREECIRVLTLLDRGG